MKKLLFITFVSLFALAINGSAKAKVSPEVKAEAATEVVNTNTLKGIVFDKLTNESLAGVVVTANGQKVYTDLEGNFTIQNVCTEKCELKISLISYADQILEVETQNAKPIKIQLSQR
ncbi:MAG TPA: carboxypeptidase-like regulatory domain-containing protein [Paludibacter sp.]|nr:carboxypeptidase-like regulatory domain-containing protein [Paludibacter sp.]